MTTAADAPLDRSVMPPSERRTVLGWMRRNLFSDLLNSALTVVAAAIVILVALLLLRWAFTSAQWGVIPANFNLIMRGQYPADEAWRLWLALYLLGGVIGLMWRLISGKFSTAALIIFLIPLALREVPLFSWMTRFHLLLVAGAGAGAFYLGAYLPIQRSVRAAVYVLLAYLVVMLVILRGYSGDAGPMPTVTTILWGGLLLSLLLAFFGITLSFPLGVALALGRQSKLPAIRIMSVIYIEFIRGVPLISLLFMGQVMLQLFLPDGFPLIDRVLRALVAIILFSAAYTAENVRGGLQSISRGQYEAAQALGLSTYRTTMHIILPQALRAVIPVLVGQFISLFKDTTLVALVGLFDLLGIARTITANPDWLGTQQEVFVLVAALFWIFSYTMSYASRRIEERLGVGER